MNLLRNQGSQAQIRLSKSLMKKYGIKAPEQLTSKKPLQSSYRPQFNYPEIKKPYVLDFESKLLILDNESYNLGQINPLKGAKVNWLGVNDSITSLSNSQGITNSPFLLHHSSVFIVEKKGYIPAIGYAIAGELSLVMLEKTSRLKPILNSLEISFEHNKTQLIFGRVFDAQLKPAADMTLESLSGNKNQVFYSSGSLTLFNKNTQQTGSSGEFLALSDGEDFFHFTAQKKSNKEKWSDQIISLFKKYPVLSFTFVEGFQNKFEAAFVDAYTRSEIENEAFVLVGKNSQMETQNRDGLFDFSFKSPRNNVLDMQFFTKGYLKTTLHHNGKELHTPEDVFAFTPKHIKRILGYRSASNRSYIFGQLRKDIYEESVKIRIYDSIGREYTRARVHYFNQNNVTHHELDRTHPDQQNFAISLLPSGQWTVVVMDEEESELLSSQVVRIYGNRTVSQILF